MSGTPGPWEVIGRRGFGPEGGPAIGFAGSGRKKITDEMIANAEYIVRAVNSHADLLAIAKRALNESARVRPDFAADIRTAIAAAEGETT